MNSICVVGLGYIGLPTAAMFAQSGIQVVGYDTNEAILSKLEKGGIHIDEPDLDRLVAKVVSDGKLTVSRTVPMADVFIIAVPTPIQLDKTADLTAVVHATEAIAPQVRRGNLVVLESTSPPGTTNKVVRSILEAATGLVAGRDFLLAYSPERVLPGKIVREMVTNDRVIGGINDESTEATCRIYERFVQGKLLRTDATTAEFVKLMENTYRDINIAIANEFALISEHLSIDVWEAIDLANHHPRVNVLRPGPGVGGHCIAVDPWFLVEAAPELARLIETARNTNDRMPHHVVRRIKELLREEDGKVALLGLTFKPDVDDVRESPAFEVYQLLLDEGIEVMAFDPHVKSGAKLASSLEEAVHGAALTVLLVDHREFAGLKASQLQALGVKRVFDTRGRLDPTEYRSSGVRLVRLGGRFAPSFAVTQVHQDTLVLGE